MKFESKKLKNGWTSTATCLISCTSSAKKTKKEAEIEARHGVDNMLVADLAGYIAAAAKIPLGLNAASKRKSTEPRPPGQQSA